MLIDLREKIKNSLTRAKLRNSLGEEGKGMRSVEGIVEEWIVRREEESFEAFSSRCRITPGPWSSLFGRDGRTTLGKKQISSNKGREGSGTLRPTQVSPLSVSAYGNECQCSSRKHDLGWNNPFGKGLRLCLFVSDLLSFSFKLSLFPFLFSSSSILSLPHTERNALPRTTSESVPDPCVHRI